MIEREWTAEVQGRRVVLTGRVAVGLGGGQGSARLSIDGRAVDGLGPAPLAGRFPRLRGQVAGRDGRVHVVEAFVRPGLTRLMGRICVDGRQVAGDLF